MTHYELDVDPEPLELAAIRLRRAGRALEDAGTGATRESAGWDGIWRGDAATAATVEAEGLAVLLARGAGALDAAAGAYDRLADAYRQSLEVELLALEVRSAWARTPVRTRRPEWS